MPSDTNKLISFLQVFGIILVVVGHSGIAEPSPFTYIHDWIYNFHMPLFMFISGFLFRHTTFRITITDTTLSSFIFKKAKRLLIPYIVWPFVAWPIKAVLNLYAIRPVELSAQAVLHSFLYPMDNPILFFWFLPTLFVVFLVVFSLLKSIRSNWILLIPMTFAVICIIEQVKITGFFALTEVAKFLLWWILGYYWCQYESKLIYRLHLNSTLFLCVTFILTILIMLVPNPENTISRIYAPLIGILFSIQLGLFYNRIGANFLNHLNGYSYSIYLLSWFPQVFFRILLCQILNLPWYCYFVVGILSGIYLPWLAAKFAKTNYSQYSFIKLLFGV